ncbi:divalent-cation tolerance protein CutA [Rivularia sp. UHCC 0363]|uniref:divalent-cation tolerance protein CutA n=1 Tax=Rivularia sp. UHCC 0363 TaxID=3110244 RepID=UPI002B1F260D|nr:divalent-cation tolerance protein CutA [Rivularia sp. UHCC 0363]MEA5598528.1 divalent-cation tolerance protein CutA [Rivularia sp. UHCC 0363]
MDNTECGIVLVTTGSQQEAEKIANALVEAKLAACVSFTSINSIYTWQGKVSKDQEWQLFIKTDLTRFPTVEAKILELHSYEVPEIIVLPIIKGHQPYLQWIAQQVD